MKRLVLLLAVSLLPIMQAAPVSAEPRSPNAVSCGPAWRVVDSADGTGSNNLYGTYAVSPTDIWAVGDHRTLGNDHPLFEHWNGTSWSSILTSEFGVTGSYFTAVSGVSASDFWVAGITNDQGVLDNFTAHWTGSSFAGSNSHTLFSTPNQLNDIFALSTNDVWAVGQVTSSNVQRTVAIHWNGTTWSAKTTPNVGTGDNVLSGVFGTASGDVWAVGYANTPTGSAQQPLIEHWNGAAWSLSSTPALSGSVTLSAVGATASNDAWAVGSQRLSNGSFSLLTLQWDGAAWSNVAGANAPALVNVLRDVVAISSTSYVAVGYTGTGFGPLQPLVYTWDGASWAASGGVPTGSNSMFFSVAAPAAGDVWAVGTFQDPGGLSRTLTENYSGLNAPTGVTAAPGDGSATVSWTAPCSDGGSGITSYVVTAYDGCTVQGSATVSGAPPGTTAVVSGLTNGNRYVFAVAAVNGFGLGPPSLLSPAMSPSGATVPASNSVCSAQQYSLAGSDGGTWQDIDSTNLMVTFTPAVDSYAVLKGNADLWTNQAGFNQDLGVALTSSDRQYPLTQGQPEAWKESGGFAGTYSPNAAFVQTVVPVAASVTYTARLVWKANRADPSGSIFAGAGPLAGAFSPTRLAVQLVPQSLGLVYSTSSTLQYEIGDTDGTTWMPIDTNTLELSITPPAGSWIALVRAGADLWTDTPGYNQDLGVSVSGPGFPTDPGQPEAWKESGGFAGTFSPNAAFVQAPVSMSGGNTYDTTVVWKANKADPNGIFAGAGPINLAFSPTSLSVVLVPVAAETAKTSWSQALLYDSDGLYWDYTDLWTTPGGGALSITPAADASYEVSVNADLWTKIAGYNQDIGILVAGGAYGAGTVVAWKESGGFAGTYSPNAAYVVADLNLRAGVAYTVWIVWKTNRYMQTPGDIVIGAGPIGIKFSPSWLTAIDLG